MGSAADRAFGEVDNDVTEEEIKAMKRLGAIIGNGVGRNVAERYATPQTVEILEHFGEILPDWASGITLSMVRADKTRVRAGESSQLFTTSELIDKAKSHDEVAAKLTETTEALKKLEDAANNAGPLALGAGSSGSMAELIKFCTDNPATIPFLLGLGQKLETLPSDDQNERSVAILEIAAAKGGMAFVDDPSGGPRRLASVLNAVAKSRQDTQALVEANLRNSALEAELIRVKKERDANKVLLDTANADLAAVADDTNPTSWAGVLKQANADLTAVRQELEDVRNPSKDGSLAKQLEDAKAAASATSTPSQELVAAQARLKQLDEKYIPSLQAVRDAVIKANNLLGTQRSLPVVTKPAEDAKKELEAAMEEFKKWGKK